MLKNSNTDPAPQCVQTDVIRSLSSRQKWVYIYLKNFCKKGDWISPTQVGKEYGKAVLGRDDCHSATGSPILKELLLLGLVERHKKGHYRLSLNFL